MVNKEDLLNIVPEDTADKYYDAWGLLLIFWLSIWDCSNVDWSRHRKTMHTRFTNWLKSALRRSSSLSQLGDVFASQAKLFKIGRNIEHVQFYVELCSSPEARQDEVLTQLREELIFLVALVFEYQRQRKENYGG